MWLSPLPRAVKFQADARQNVEAAGAGLEQAEARYRDTVTFRNLRGGLRLQKKFREACLV